MKKSAYLRDILREIKNSRNRFISILLIVFLGAGFFVGVKATSPSIRDSANEYFTEMNLMDIRILSTVGFDDGDADEIRKIDGITDVMPAYSIDAVLASDGVSVVTVMSYPDLTANVSGENTENYDFINKIELTEGRLPEAPDECIVCNNRFIGNTYELGDKITLTNSAGENNISDYLSEMEFTVVGYYDSPMYFSYSYGNTSIGDGSVSLIMYVPQSTFTYIRYTVMYAKIDVPADAEIFDTAYDDKIEEIAEKLEALGVERFEVFKNQSEQLYDDAKKDLNEQDKLAKDQMQEAKEQLDSAKEQIDKALSEIEEGWREFDAAKLDTYEKIEEAEAQLEANIKALREAEAQLEESEAQYESALKMSEIELAAAKAELDAAQRELNAARREITAGEREYNIGKAEYDAALIEYNKAKAEYDAKYKEYTDGEAAYAAGKAEYDAGLIKYNDGIAKLAEGQAEYNEALAEYNKNYAVFKPEIDKYNAGKAEYDAALAEYDAGKAEYDTKRAELDAATNEYREKLSEYNTAFTSYSAALMQLPLLRPILTDSQYAEMERQLQNAKKELDASKLLLDDALAQINAAEAEMESYRLQLEDARLQLQDAKKQLDAAWVEIEPYKTQFDDAKAQLDAAAAELDSGRTELSDSKKELDAAAVKLNDSRQQLNEARTLLNNGRKELQDAEAQINSAAAELSDARHQLDTGKEEYEKGLAEYNSGLQRYNTESRNAADRLADAEKEISDAKIKIADGNAVIASAEAEVAAARAEADKEFNKVQSDLEDAEKQLEESQKEYEEGLEEYNKNVADAEAQLADAQNRIRMLGDLINNVESGKWYVSPRESAIVNYESLKDDCSRLDAIANIFPAFFIAVACLVCLTTMSRMVDEQRTQMGTYKALGYSNAKIRNKYVIYALSASVIGAVGGIALCVQILPRAIFNAYKVLYSFPNFKITMPWLIALISIAVFVICTFVVTFICCNKELKVTTAALMRPKSPKAGKKIIIERIGFIWRHFNFQQKVTSRNLFRYKARLIMTILGISGCMMLIVAGFGLQNSILAIVDSQYGDIFSYDLDVYPGDVDENDSVEDRYQRINEYEFVDTVMFSMQKKVTASANGETVSENLTLFVPENTEKMHKMINLYDIQKVRRIKADSETLTLSGDGAVISEKMSKTLGIASGDEIDITVDEKDYKIKVSAICKNYVYDMIFISPEYYESIFTSDDAEESAEIDYNMIAITLKEGADEAAARAALIADNDDIAYVLSLSTVGSLLSDMINGLNVVVVIMILCAGALAFLVVYNLTNINISERIREIATIKVLGFKHFEVDMYVFRENIVMCFAGILFGSIFGHYLAQYMISTIEVNMTMFERNLQPGGYIYAALLTLIFTVFVNLVMTKRMKSISMVESLKAIE